MTAKQSTQGQQEVALVITVEDAKLAGILILKSVNMVICRGR